MDHIKLQLGDITSAKVDAIVNAANSKLLGGGGVDGAIHRAAGPALLEACKKLPQHNGVRCPTGEARLTPAGNLAAKYVIHAVGPVYNSDPHPAARLEAAYDNSFQLALQHGCRSVALPAISCGVYGYPPHEAAEIALASADQAHYRDLDIHFYLFSEELFNTWQEVHQRLGAQD